MEELLTPQICMEVDDTPLNVKEDDGSDSDTLTDVSEQNDDNDKVEKLLLLEFNTPAQVPENLTDTETIAKNNVFGPSDPAVQFHRVHCTACNVHLGSAPVGFFDRYIHPLLKVIICKSCYEFYCSGEFDKDEDGSEMYCRWCGQGGKVMCCAQCAYVFCQKCIRQNLGKKTLDTIKDSDDWLCFGCNPSQLINLKITCVCLFRFMRDEIELAKALGNIERLKTDHSMCCIKGKGVQKRKRKDDETYHPYSEEPKLPKKQKVVSIAKVQESLKTKLASKKDGTVRLPQLSGIMGDNRSNATPVMVVNKENKLVPMSSAGPRILPKKPAFAVSKPLYITSSGNVPIIRNPLSNVVKVQMTSVPKLVTPTNSTSTSVPVMQPIPVQLAPNLPHEWFQKAASVVSTITGNLSFTLDHLTNDLKASNMVENLATVHNRLQELLSTSINSLIQVRKNLRNQFLGDLHKLQFAADMAVHRSGMSAAADMSTMNKKFVPIVPKMVMNNKKEDDDVVIVKSDIQRPAVNGRPYLKVRSVSQLLSVPSECITIPDEPSPPPEPPKDPLSLRSLLESNNDGSEVQKDDSKKCEKKENEKKDVEMTDNNNKNENGNLDCDPMTTILIKNALTESKIDQLVEENGKSKTNFPEGELKKMLSVRVIVASNMKPDLPKNRLSNKSNSSNDKIDENPQELMDSNEQPDEEVTNQIPLNEPIKHTIIDSHINKAINESTNETVTNEPVERSTNETISNEPVEESLNETVLYKLDEESTIETVLNQPVKESINETVSNELVEGSTNETVSNKPVEESTSAALSSNTLEESMVEALLNDPLEKPTNESFFNNALDGSAIETLLNEPTNESRLDGVNKGDIVEGVTECIPDAEKDVGGENLGLSSDGNETGIKEESRTADGFVGSD